MFSIGSFCLVRLVRRFLPQILVAVAISSIMLVAYASAGFVYATSPKATWAANPLTISFPATKGSESTSDFLTCSSNISGISLRTIVSNPTRMSLTAELLSEASCSSSLSGVNFTVHCLVSADLCRGTYHGLVQIRQDANYRVIPANLKVVITVT